MSLEGRQVEEPPLETCVPVGSSALPGGCWSSPERGKRSQRELLARESGRSNDRYSAEAQVRGTAGGTSWRWRNPSSSCGNDLVHWRRDEPSARRPEAASAPSGHACDVAYVSLGNLGEEKPPLPGLHTRNRVFLLSRR